MRQPVRIVFDRQARLPLDSRLLATLDQSPVLAVVGPEADRGRVGALEGAGAEILAAADIETALRELGRREITSLFLEGGRTLADAFIAADQLDESRAFIAPVLLGSADSDRRAGGAGEGRGEDDPARSALPPPATGPARHTALASSIEQVGEDVLVIARYKEW